MSHQPNFNRLPRLYRWMELVSFGPWLWWCRCAFLGDLLTCRRAVVLGDGDRRFTARLLKANPAVQIDAIDASPALLQSLVRRAGPHAGRIRTQVADARGWRPEGRPAKSPENLPYDLVVTHFFLDCLTTEEVRSLAATLRAAVSPSARWVVSEFALPEGWFGRLVAGPLVWGLIAPSAGSRGWRFAACRTTPRPCARPVSPLKRSAPSWEGCSSANFGPQTVPIQRPATTNPA